MSSTHSAAIAVMAAASGHIDNSGYGQARPRQGHKPSHARRRWTVRSRLYLCFLLVLYFMALVTFAGIQEVNKIDRDLTRATDIAAAKQRYAVNMRGSVHDRAIAVRDLALTSPDDQARAARLRSDIDSLGGSYARN